MIHEGERNLKEKLKLIAELKKRKKQEDIRLAKRNITMFLCSECGLLISFEPKGKKTNKAYMSSDYKDFHVYFEKDPDYKPFENKYKKNLYINWCCWCNSICLNCGSYIENNQTVCEKCGSDNIVAGNELSGKPCPVCGTPLNVGISIQGFENYQAKKDKIENDFFNIYRKRYNIKEQIPPKYSKEEIVENERRKALRDKVYFDDTYILDNSHNAIRFEFDDSFMSGYFLCALEWDNDSYAKLLLFNFCDLWIEKNIDCKEVNRVIEILNKYDYFNQTFYKKDKSFRLDGYTFGLEVKCEKKYKELCIWGIRGGILYEVGMLLIKLAGKTFKELYKYAW